MLRYSKHGAMGFCAPVALFFLFVSINVSAQSNKVKADTAQKAEAIYQLYEDIKKQPGTSDPLVMVDDSVYNGDIKDIKSEDVTSIDVIKGDDAKQIFGSKAQNGAFMIKTKYYGNKPSTVTGPTRKFLDSPVVYVVDGMPIPQELVNTDDVLIRDVLKGHDLDKLYSDKKPDSVVVMVTKKYAIIDYQMKFSAFSKKYKDYLTEHKRKDDSCTYVLNGVSLQNGSDETIKKLYSVKSQEITEVAITENPLLENGSAKFLVLITTKQ